ncbi:MAG: DNA-directed RNA polymerase subunit omega [Rickettsiales bacterium]|jgi:DNA-directed RNA polymerase subunit omega|nr:DNA-directed RNA polymerase subunit omega [Rickettsiales bacterium]
MARVTVEDCTKIISNRFELVILASRRARDIAAGSEVTIERENDKDAVISLREIADQKISKDILTNNVIESYQDRSEYEASVIERDNSGETRPETSVTSPLSSKPANVKVHDGEFAEDNLEVND